MSHPNKPAGIALVAIALTLSACGGDDAPAGEDMSASHEHEQQAQHEQHQLDEQDDTHHESHERPDVTTMEDPRATDD